MITQPKLRNLDITPLEISLQWYGIFLIDILLQDFMDDILAQRHVISKHSYEYCHTINSPWNPKKTVFAEDINFSKILSHLTTDNIILLEKNQGDAQWRLIIYTNENIASKFSRQTKYICILFNFNTFPLNKYDKLTHILSIFPIYPRSHYNFNALSCRCYLDHKSPNQELQNK